MENFYNLPVIWMIAGFIFFLLEFAVPGLILFFFAVGAWIVALLSLFFNMSINAQLIIFLAGSVLTILLFRNWVKKMIWAKKNSTELEDEFIGKSGKAETIIATFATFFIGRDAEEEDAPVAGAKDIEELKKSIVVLTRKIDELKSGNNS